MYYAGVGAQCQPLLLLVAGDFPVMVSHDCAVVAPVVKTPLLGEGQVGVAGWAAEVVISRALLVRICFVAFAHAVLCRSWSTVSTTVTPITGVPTTSRRFAALSA